MSSWTENDGNSGIATTEVGASGDGSSLTSFEGCHRGTREDIWESATEAAVRVSKLLECK